MSERKFTPVEQIMIDKVDEAKFNSFECSKDGLYQSHKFNGSPHCPRCGKVGKKLDITQLRMKK